VSGKNLCCQIIRARAMRTTLGRDLIMSYSRCAFVGGSKAVVWTYAVGMTLLLVHRWMHDERRLEVKCAGLGPSNCRRVAWRFVPGI